MMKLALPQLRILGLIAILSGNGLNLAVAQVSAGDVSRRIQLASGYIVVGAQAAALSRLPAPPAISAQDAAGTCVNTELRFFDQAGRGEWVLPGYNSMLNLWAILHDGARAGTSRGTRCEDMEFSARRWQQALGEPVTGALTEAQARRFTSIIDANEPSFAASRARREGRPVIANAQRDTRSEPSKPRDLRPGTYGLQWHVNGCFERELAKPQGSKKAILDCLLGPVPDPLGNAGAPPVTLRIDIAKLSLGVDQDVAKRLLAGPLCSSNAEGTVACRAAPTLVETCGHEDRALVEFRQRVFRKIDSAVRFREPLNQFHDDVVAYPRLEDALTTCKERHAAAPETSAELVFDGSAVRSAKMTFNQQRLVEIRLQATDADIVSRWMTSRYGAPTVALGTAGNVEVRTVPLTALTDQVFVEDRRRTVRHQTWSAPGIAVQAEDGDFRITAVGQR